MTGEKEDAVERLRTELQSRLTTRGLSKEEKLKIRQQLVGLSNAARPRRRAEKKPEKKIQEVSPQAQARQDALDLQERVQFIGERQGAYKAAWIKYFAVDGSAVATLMGDIIEHLKLAQDVAEAVLSADKPADDLIIQLEAAIANVNGTVMPTLQQVEAHLREEEAASGTQVSVGDPMQVLDALEAGCPPEDWMPALRSVRNRSWVIGSSITIGKLTKLITRYVDTWDGLGTDGLKGASYSGLEALAKLRMEIVQVIAESGEVPLMACCGPGTEFYNYINKLASQSCSSRDVQNFKGWWAANSRTVD